jgi:hypothetical protein
MVGACRKFSDQYGWLNPTAMGQKATSRPGNATSVAPPGPDIADRAGHVGFVPITVIPACPLSGTLLQLTEDLWIDESATYS